MKKANLIFGVIVFILSIPIIFYLWFGIGMISNNSPKSINTDWVKQYKTTMKADYININTTKVYYQFGRVHFDFIVNPQMSVDEYTQIVKKTKDLVLKKTMSKIYDDQTNLTIKFDSEKDIYVYNCPYWLPTENDTDNPNILIENNYKLWYLQINDEPEVKTQF